MRANTLMVLAGALTVLAASAVAQPKEFEPFDFPTGDPSGVYTMLEMRKVGKDQVETLVRQRMVRSGNLSFTRRLIDCKAMRFKTLASAFDDMESLKRSKPDPNWSTFVNGSSAHGTAVAACARL
jgi:hypothetical protein